MNPSPTLERPVRKQETCQQKQYTWKPVLYSNSIKPKALALDYTQNFTKHPFYLQALVILRSQATPLNPDFAVPHEFTTRRPLSIINAHQQPHHIIR